MDKLTAPTVSEMLARLVMAEKMMGREPTGIMLSPEMALRFRLELTSQSGAAEVDIDGLTYHGLEIYVGNIDPGKERVLYSFGDALKVAGQQQQSKVEALKNVLALKATKTSASSE